jgi:hypothetical protein
MEIHTTILKIRTFFLHQSPETLRVRKNHSRVQLLTANLNKLSALLTYHINGPKIGLLPEQPTTMILTGKEIDAGNLFVMARRALFARRSNPSTWVEIAALQRTGLAMTIK